MQQPEDRTKWETLATGKETGFVTRQTIEGLVCAAVPVVKSLIREASWHNGLFMTMRGGRTYWGVFVSGRG